MKKYAEMSPEELKEELSLVQKEYKKLEDLHLKLNMTRGKPSKEQLDLAKGLMDVLHSGVDMTSEDGTDCRNYGILTGIPEAKRFMGALMEVDPENVIVFGNSSLNVMYDRVASSYSFGVLGSTPWCRLPKVKWLCVVPGYDRHFKITERFGFEMINVPMLPDGPDMDMVEKLVSTDAAIKGIWCVPKYSNPTGNSYSDEVVRRFAALKPAARDFRIYWDNAYCVHHLYRDREKQDVILELYAECKKNGNPNLVYKFASTSKISFPGSGISALAASGENVAEITNLMSYQTIGHDKVNQLRHVRFFENMDGVKNHMMRLSDLMRPKFEAVENILESEIGGLEIGEWTRPNGGYFISFKSVPGCAKAIFALAKDIGVELTNVGDVFPYGKDPEDAYIRIAPTFPSLSEIETASHVFAICVKLATLKKLLSLNKIAR